MNNVLKDLISNTMEVYVHDLVIKLAITKNHSQHIEKVFPKVW